MDEHSVVSMDARKVEMKEFRRADQKEIAWVAALVTGSAVWRGTK